MTAVRWAETVSEPLGPVNAGGHAFQYEKHVFSENGTAWPPVYDFLGLPALLGVTVQRRGGLNDGPWGVDIHLKTDGYAVPPSLARQWAHAVLAASDLADGFEEAEL